MRLKELFEDQSLLTRRRTKIVCTLGPATDTPDMIRTLIRDGMNCARVNASHGNHEEHANLIRLVRKLAKEVGRPVAVLYDLQGPKIRVREDTPDLPRTVSTGDEICFVVRKTPEGAEIGVDYDGLDHDVEPGQPLLVDDGAVATKIVRIESGRVFCLVENDGVIQQRKGINLPQTSISVPAMTEKDQVDALFAISQKVDVIALSFVRRTSDVIELKDLIAGAGSRIRVISKIEKSHALEDLHGIIEASWGVMVARGDLGVELSPEEVPTVQKKIIREANRRCRPVITATQMLDSMTRNPRPTRAEASDVANAVLDGTDAVMLSQETATGKYPIETVRMMVRILRTTENYHQLADVIRRREPGVTSTHEAVADAAVQVAHDIEAHAIVAFTQTGNSALLAAQRRPARQIVVFTTNEKLNNLCALIWGIRSYLIDRVSSTDELFRKLDEEMLKDGLASKGDSLVLLMGAPTHRLGPPNLMLVHTVGEWSSLG